MAKTNDADLQKRIDQLEAENAELKNKPAQGITMKVATKGGISVYGTGRFPATYYQEQWIAILGVKDEILQFIKDNQATLKAKK